jgi:hypothetical protein
MGDEPGDWCCNRTPNDGGKPMRGKKIKALRKLVYRNKPSSMEHRRYVQNPDTGVIYATDERRAYTDSKKIIKELKKK